MMANNLWPYFFGVNGIKRWFGIDSQYIDAFSPWYASDKKQNEYFETHDDFEDLKGPPTSHIIFLIEIFQLTLLPFGGNNLNIPLQIILSKIIPTFNETSFHNTTAENDLVIKHFQQIMIP